ncbi:hypothetical protein SCANM63S_07093 [Streptomyces canarius]
MRRASAGYLSLSTIAPAPVATFCGKVASADDRWKVTVCASSAVTEASVSNRDAGPTSELIFLTRSKEYLTSCAVMARPLGKVIPERRVHRYVLRPLPSNAQLCAASGTGSTPPGSNVSNDWNTLLNSAQEPAS